MKNTLFALAAALGLLVGLAVPAGATADRAAVYWWDGSPVGGGSQTDLDRGDVSLNAHLRGLPGGQAITIWAVVFENPDNCGDVDVVDPGTGDVIVPGAPGCGEDDVVRSFIGMDNGVDLTVTFAAGGVTNGGGNLNVHNAIGGGDTLIGDGTVDNTESAEIHFVVRSHGPDQPGDADTTTFIGGCDVDLPPGTVPAAVGECSDVQFSVHIA